MKIKKFFSRRATSLLLVCLLALTMFSTGALAAEVTDEEIHVHTEECVHDEITVETQPVSADASEPEAEPVAEITVEPENMTISETEPATEESTETADPYSGTIGESSVVWSLDPATGQLIINGSGDCEGFTSAEDQPWAAVREEITEVWFYDMDALAISDLAYWFDGCTALTMAEIPYTTPVIGERAFADCPTLRTVLIYHDGCFSIKAGAFATDMLTPLEIRYVPSSGETASILASYNWKADNRAAFYEDAYGITLLATGTCSLCNVTCSYTLDYEYWTEEVHAIRHWCSNCGLDQCGGANAGSHSFSNGVCTLCGYDNGSGSTGGGTVTCYHSSSYYSWSGCTYYEYCSSCGEYLGSGTSHGTYSYGSWEYYNSSRHRRYYSCNDCGEGSYSYGYHSTATKYTEYSSTQHKYGKCCSVCNSYVGTTSYASHNFSYGSWTKYSSTQHRRTVSCTSCSYSSYEYASHSLSYGAWISTGDSQHSRTVSCSCGYSTTEYASHSLTYGDWEISEGTYYSSKHQRTISCSCGYSTTEYEAHSLYGVSDYKYHNETYHMREEECACGYPCNVYSYHSYKTSYESVSDTTHNVIKTCSYCNHSTTSSEAHGFTYGDWVSYSDSQHVRTATCSCEYEGLDYGTHSDSDDDGYCDACQHLMTRFSVTLPANLIITVSEYGEVFSATNAAVVNYSTHGVEITSVTVSAGKGWTLVPYDYNMADEKVDSKLIGFYLNGAETTQTGTDEILVLPDNWTIDRDESFELDYDAVLSATSATIQNEQVLTIVFVINWAPR